MYIHGRVTPSVSSVCVCVCMCVCIHTTHWKCADCNFLYVRDVFLLSLLIGHGLNREKKKPPKYFEITNFGDKKNQVMKCSSFLFCFVFFFVFRCGLFCVCVISYPGGVYISSFFFLEI